jgi:hypothetical protein
MVMLMIMMTPIRYDHRLIEQRVRTFDVYDDDDDGGDDDNDDDNDDNDNDDDNDDDYDDDDNDIDLLDIFIVS